MNKNRRKSKLSNLSDFLQQQKQNTLQLITNKQNKQNQAKLKLLDIEHNDFMHSEFMICNYAIGKNNMLEKMKQYEERLQEKKFSRSTGIQPFDDQNNILSPLDSNINYQINNFVSFNNCQTPQQPKIKNHRFSFRDTPFSKQRKNIQTHNNIKSNKFLESQSKIQQKTTIKNLKRILKKLESPQKGPKKRTIQQARQYNMGNNFVSRKIVRGNDNKIMDYCSEFFSYNEKQKRTDKSSRKSISSQNNFIITMNSALGNYNNGGRNSEMKTSQSKRRLSFGIGPSSSNSPTSTPNYFTASKPGHKITNTCNFFKRNSVGTADLTKKNRSSSGIRKYPSNSNSGKQMIGTNSNLQRNQFEDIFLHNQRFKQQRKQRNLKNILFE